ncbi:unnamed protein product [Didymodactylos carnosus]|nr:unnamed protein product [Didymodactylos carnosus]CAF4092738.1 unnamed protein product [Didymodactylos carnosus]
MGDIKASTNFVKEGIKLLQKKSNPVELFVQKRLEYLKKNSLTVTTAYILVFEMLYLWTTVPCCEHDTLRKMLEIIERFGTDSKDDSRLRPIACLVEGAIQHVLMNLDNAQNCYEEALARVDDTKLNFTRYVAPFSTCELGILEYLHHRNPNRAKEMLTKAKDKYSEFDFDNRLQIRSVAALKMINSSER